MKTLWDSSEIKEAAELFNDVLVTPESLPVPEDPGIIESQRSGPVSRGDRLEDTLAEMCARGQFHSALLADKSGLPIAAYNCPVDTDLYAAFTPDLGIPLKKTGQLFSEPGVNFISIDLNVSDKLMFLEFLIDEYSYFLAITCPKTVDDRDEIDRGVSGITRALA